MNFSPSPSRLSPLHGRLSRSSSSRSTETSIEMKEWRPTQAVPLTGMEGTTKGGGAMVTSTIGRAEKNLSSLFVENERKAGTPERLGRKNGWGGSLVSGAMNAGVFGAALGLTAYRFWSGDEPQSPTTSMTPSTSASSATTLASTSVNSSAGPSSVRYRPDSVELPPPPAYTESDIRRTHSVPEEGEVEGAEAEEDEAWQDELEPAIKYLKRLHERVTPPRLPKHRKGWSRSRMPKISTRSVASITVEDIRPPLSDHPPVTPSKPPETSGIDDGGDAEDDGLIDPVEVLHRLDSVSETIQAMIAEGRKALAAPSPVVISEGWLDEAIISPSTPHGRDSGPEQSPLASRSQRKKLLRRGRGGRMSLSLVERSPTTS